MIDLITGNKLLDCPIGFYDVTAQTFIVVVKVNDITSLQDDEYILVVSHEDNVRDNETYKVLYEFSAQDLADSLSTHTKVVNTVALNKKAELEND